MHGPLNVKLTRNIELHTYDKIPKKRELRVSVRHGLVAVHYFIAYMETIKSCEMR